MRKKNIHGLAGTRYFKSSLLFATSLFSSAVLAHPGHAVEYKTSLLVVLLAVALASLELIYARRKLSPHLVIAGEHHVSSHSHENRRD